MLKLTFTKIAREFGLSQQAISDKAKRSGHDGSLKSWYKLLNYYFNKYKWKNEQ